MGPLFAFDIETAKLLPEGTPDLLAHRPLGIACAVGVARDLPRPVVWHGRDNAQHPTPQMTNAEAAQLVSDLEALVSQGFTIVTWNGLGFDFAVLADESKAQRRCEALALAHVDLLFHATCSLGHYIGLQKAAEGMQLSGKRGGLSGAQAPALWAAGNYSQVLDYCTQDVRLTLELAETCSRKGHLAWVTQRGAVRRMSLPDGWLTVTQSLQLPLPDTSWMSDPPPRKGFFSWFAGGCPA